MNKDKEVADIRKLADRLTPADYDRKKICIYLSAATVIYLGRVYGNRNVILQAGSASWPIIDLDKDDGVKMTHFSYQFSAFDPQTIMMMRQGLLPEMHAWCYDKQTGAFIDLSVCYVKDNAKELANLDMTGPPLPDYFWCRPDQLPKGVVYKPDETAMRITHNGLKNNTINQEAYQEFLKTGRV